MRLFLPFLLLLTGCYAEEIQRELQDEPFFDLSGYIDRQVDSLQTAGTVVTKSITLNGTSETREITDLNFANDLRVFREADINKPAWVDKYTVEREADGNRVVRTYVAVDSSMQTRRLRVVTMADDPVLIEIYRKTGTVLSDGRHQMTYEPTSGYEMVSRQINRFGEDLDADIEVRWKKKR